MTSHDDSQAKTNAWIRALPLWHLLFAVTLGTSVVITLTGITRWDQAVMPLFFSALLAVWYSVSVWWVNRRSDTPPFYLLAFFIMGWLVWFTLTHMNLVYMFLLLSLFPHVFMSMRLPWGSTGAVILMCFVIFRQSAIGNGDIGTIVISMSLMTLGGIIIARFIEAIISESIERQRLITTLESTRRELAAAERQAGILQERQRLAGEIHDTLAQGLTSIVMHLEAAEGALDNRASVQHHLNEARSTARANLAEARRVVWGLRPQALEMHSFEQAIAEIVNAWAASNQITAEHTVIGTRTALSPDTEIALLRTVQEALANIANHAHAKHVVVTLSYIPNAVVVDVHDDGVGLAALPKPENGHRGFGLLNMRQRLEQLRGTLTIESISGEGTTLVAEIPLPSAQG